VHLPGGFWIEFSTRGIIAGFVTTVVTLDMGDLAWKLSIPF